MKKCFIGMSINKQLYFGIFGISSLFGFLCLFLILLASTKLFLSYNIKIKSIINEMDTNIVLLNGENADFFGQLLFNQGKFETFLLRNYYKIFKEDFGNDLLDIINLETEEINNHFKYHNIESDLCEEENSKCYFIFAITSQININEKTKKILYFFISVLDISLDTYSYNKENYLILNKFHFYEKENNVFISYKYNKKDIEKNFMTQVPPQGLMNNNLNSFLNTINSIESLNHIKVSELTYNDFFNLNTFIISPSFANRITIDPFFKSLSVTFHFGSYQFKQNDNEKVNIDKLNLDNLENYMSFDMKTDYLSVFSLNFIERNGAVFVFIITDDFQYTESKSMCKLVDFTNYTYSDESIHNNLNFTIELLSIEDLQLYDINECFPNEKVLKIISSDLNYDYTLKLLSNIYKYSYDKDINNQIVVKLIRYLSPGRSSKNVANIKFYSSFSVYFLVVKIYNNILIINNLIDRITYRSIAYITIFTFILWFIIFIFVFIKLYLVADRISSPIRKLIKSISLSQGNFNNNSTNLEKIYYREDKDINDLFQLCQRLIIGGFRKKNNIQKQNKLNVYNNISKVKTNNMIINENDIIIQRNKKYNEIFEKGNELENKDDNFKNDIYYQYKNDDFDKIIQNYESIKIKKISTEKKDELESLKVKDSEYKMFYYINKEIENYLPFNNLYKYYYDEFSKKGNKKKKK